MTKTILIDADIVLYQACCACEVATDWGNDIWTLVADAKECRQRVDVTFADLKDELKADEVVICLSDTENWRKSVYPAYKSNRKKTRKPLIYPEVKQYLLKVYRSFMWPQLEADDVLGILATSNRYIKGEKIIVSEDKDLKTIPGLLYNPGKPELGVVEITKKEADRNHLIQSLAGDRTDGYPGCPGVGPKGAEKVVDDGWDGVVQVYENAGITEQEALVQAQVARILRANEWTKTKGVKLWQPK